MSAEQLGRFCKSRSFSPWKKRCWATISRTSATKTLPWDIINPASIALVLREFMAVVLMTSSSAQRTLTFWKAQRGWDVASVLFLLCHLLSCVASPTLNASKVASVCVCRSTPSPFLQHLFHTAKAKEDTKDNLR